MPPFYDYFSARHFPIGHPTNLLQVLTRMGRLHVIRVSIDLIYSCDALKMKETF